MDTTFILAYSVAALVMVLIPGPDMLLVLSRSVCQGTMAGVMSVFGFVAGGYIHAVFAGIGLTALVATSPTLLLVVQIGGALYLLYLAVTILRSETSSLRLKGVETKPLQKIFVQGFITNVMNPKMFIFYMAFIPQFIDPDFDHIFLQFIIYTTILNVIGATFNISLSFAAGSVGDMLAKSEKVVNILEKSLAAIFVLLALRLGLSTTL